MTSPRASSGHIRVRGARQHNLKDITVAFPLGCITVVTGPSGSGKSSLAFDTLYAEGQRRYVESFSAYARQFMDRMDRPDVDAVEGVLPAVAIDQTNAIKSSRSSVGTVTELTDYVKVLYARVGRLHCGSCGQPVVSDEPEQVLLSLLAEAEGRRAVVTFPVDVGGASAAEAAAEWLASEGYQRLWQGGRVVDVADAKLSKRKKTAPPLEVVADRIVLRGDEDSRSRAVDSIEAAMQRGQGRARVHVEQDTGFVERRYSRGRHCATCDTSYPEPVPNHFSFNSPLGACATCNGFGRTISLDLDLAIPDHGLSLEEGAIRPWATDSAEEERAALSAYCAKAGIPLDRPWGELTEEHRTLIIEGDKKARFSGIRGWFKWLEGRTYKMHVRVFLSRYRAYVPCAACDGKRFQPHALLYRVGGLVLCELYALDIASARAFFDDLRLGSEEDRAVTVLLREIRSRLAYLEEVGLGYLTLDRQSRTLSGGEVQRVNLTTAIGSHLVNTLYVLDEPSIGLHARDNDRLLRILERLRANRNTIVLVEHDDAIIRRADHVIDLGPGAGERGGNVVFEGTPAELGSATERSLTARYLMGEGDPMPRPPRRATDLAGAVIVRGARENNLRGIDAAFPKGALTVVSGVSGSGKSTLVEDVLYRGLLRARGEPVEAAGAHDALLGADTIERVVLVDQKPVGTTPRSNPATYVKAWAGIRDLFASQADSAQKGFGPSTFSFNTAGGRCEACEGTGFERIEMQFLSDVYVSCEQCQGRRFKEDVLSVRVRGRSIADVLEMTVAEGTRFFRTEAPIARCLEVLARVGLDYLRLGQPLNTLSGGEAQRLKLAGHLAASARAKGTRNSLFLLDEPTTGLHLSDVRVLIENLHRLVDQGNTVVVIEHHLDVIAQADHLIDLGPEGGAAGGAIVAAGTPEQVMACPESHTGRYLRAHLARTPAVGDGGRVTPLLLAPEDIAVRGARVHNLQNIDVRIPRDRLVVVTGPSGSGKSSLAFDLLFAEGQRRFIDCLSPYARQYVQQLARPDIDELLGVPPSVSIAQRTTSTGRRSTVATVTEIYHYLRLLFAKLGVQHCTRCEARVSGLGTDEILDLVMAAHDGQEVRLLAPVVRGRKGFHKDVFERARAQGFIELRVDGKLVPAASTKALERFKEHDIEVVVAQWTVSAARKDSARRYLERGLEVGDGAVHVLATTARKPRIYSRDRYCAACELGFDPPDPRLFSFNSTQGACSVCNGTGEAGAPEDDDSPVRVTVPCAACGGTRLRPTALAVRLGGRSIAELSAMTPPQLLEFLADIDLDARGEAIAGAALSEISERCLFLERVGLTYLTLDRGGHTLSGGEAQRIRLASQLSARLRGVLYILDEPTIGLHPSDNDLLLDALTELVSRGNGVLIVEHDEATIRRADHVIDMGPGGGSRGGYVVAQGTVAELLEDEASLTGRALRLGAARSLRPSRPVSATTPMLSLRGVNHHSLRDVDVDFPLGRLTVVTGVSGSGKSSLVRDALALSLAATLRGEEPTLARVIGHEHVTSLREVDQSPIGKTSRSVPATYIGFYTAIRELFAAIPDARLRGYGPGRFSFNTKGGRCEHCGGQGQVKHEMSFLPDVTVGCDVCAGRRFNEETLRVRYHGLAIDQVLGLTAEDAAALFAPVRRVHEPLALLCDVGLGYLQIGQPSQTLSGGEAQRVKLVEELARRSAGRTVYVLDEPSVGLHLDDLVKLISVLHRLVDRGDTVVVIEHDMDVIASADWIVDMGPEGGARGGQVVFQGPREGLARCVGSRTAPYLRAHLEGARAAVGETPGNILE